MRTTARMILAAAIAATALGGTAHADTCNGAAPATDVGLYVCTTGEQDPYWKPVCVIVYSDNPAWGTGRHSVCGP